MNACTIEWAWVPLGSTPSARDMATFDVKWAPPISAALTPALAPPAGPRRIPNSSTGRPRAANATRAAFVAISVG